MRRRGVLVDAVVVSRGVQGGVAARDGGVDLRVHRDATDGGAENAAWSMVRERHVAAPYCCAVGFGASSAGFLAATFAAWLDVPSVALVRGNDLDRDWYLPRRGEWLREALRRAAAIGAVSQEKVERIRRLYPEKRVIWTPNGVDVSRWELLPADCRRRDEIRGLLNGADRRVIGLFGDLKAKKGVALWLEGVRDCALLDRMSLLVVGNLDEATSRILDDPALAPRSLRLPFCAPDELPGMYAACDFVALPSAFDGMPNVLLEAMACGAVPLVSDAGALAQVVRDGSTGFVFAAGARDGAGEATARALGTGTEDLRAMSERVRQYVAERFTVDREIDVLEELLNQVVA